MSSILSPKRIISIPNIVGVNSPYRVTSAPVVLPTSDAELIAQGWPSIAGATDGDLWLCDEASGNLVGEIRGYELAPQATPTYRVDFGTPIGKVGVGLNSANSDRFNCTNTGVLHPGAGVNFTFSVLFKPIIDASYVRMAGTINATAGWGLFWKYVPNTTAEFVMRDSTGLSFSGHGPTNVFDSNTHLLTVAADRDGNHSYYYDATSTKTSAMARPGDLAGGSNYFCLGSDTNAAYTFGGQIAWAYYCIGVAADRTGHDALVTALGL